MQSHDHNARIAPATGAHPRRVRRARPAPGRRLARTALALGAAAISLAGVLAASGAAAGTTPDRSPGNAAGASLASAPGSVTRPAQAHLPPYPVVFIGDSVTAGFGYCGPEEAEKDVSCGVNQAMANSWYRGEIGRAHV